MLPTQNLNPQVDTPWRGGGAIWAGSIGWNQKNIYDIIPIRGFCPLYPEQTSVG